jgi:hypothetical protein
MTPLNVERSRFMGDILLAEERDLVFCGAPLFPTDLDLGRRHRRWSRTYAAPLRDENSDVLSISAGATLQYEPDARRQVTLVGEAFYAPDVLKFGTVDNLTDLTARVELGFGQRMTGLPACAGSNSILSMAEESGCSRNCLPMLLMDFKAACQSAHVMEASTDIAC